MKEPWATPNRATPKSCYPCQKNKTQKVKKMQRKSKTKNNTIQQLGLKKQSNPKIPPPQKKTINNI